MTRFDLLIKLVLIFFIKDFLIVKDFLLVSEIITGLIIFYSGALGQTRTGAPKRARILSPLCLPISSRGHVISFISQRFYNTINLVSPTRLSRPSPVPLFQ